MIPLPSLLLLATGNGEFALYAGNGTVTYLPSVLSATARTFTEPEATALDVLGLYAPCH